MALTPEQLEMIKDYVIVPFKMDDPSLENRKAIDDYFSKEYEEKIKAHVAEHPEK